MIKAKRGEKREEEIKEQPIDEEIVLKKRIEGKGRKFVRCHNTLLKVKSFMENGKVDAAKSLYIKARELYVKLPYEEKKEIYDEMMDVYNRLSSQ